MENVVVVIFLRILGGHLLLHPIQVQLSSILETRIVMSFKVSSHPIISPHLNRFIVIKVALYWRIRALPSEVGGPQRFVRQSVQDEYNLLTETLKCTQKFNAFDLLRNCK